MRDFEIVEGFVPRHNGRWAAVDAVIAGETVFVPGSRQTSTAGSFKRAKKAGLKVRSQRGEHEGVVGVYVWGEK